MFLQVKSELNESVFLCQLPTCCFTLLLVHSTVGRKARALYACKAEHDSELSFIAGTVFENGESGSELASRKEKGEKMWAGVFLETTNFCLKEKADLWEIAGLYLALVMDLVSFARRNYKCLAQMPFYPNYHFYNKIHWCQAFFPQHFSFDMCL